LSLCTRPIDPIDAQSLAVGAEPLIAPDAAEHVAGCGACKEVVEDWSRFSRAVEELSVAGPPPDLAERVVRLRAFSSGERRSLSIWRGPSLLSAGVFLAGVAVLSLPGLRASEQASLSMAAVLPAVAAVRALLRSIMEMVRCAPAGMEVLSQALGKNLPLGSALLLLLAPLTFGLRRVLARAPRR
jgi:hypothetical protein